jgi:hypothetical protein
MIFFIQSVGFAFVNLPLLPLIETMLVDFELQRCSECHIC